MLIVTEPAEDLQLLTEEELRVAAGLEPDDDSQDEALAIQGLRAASALAAACGVAKAGYDASLAPLRGAAPRTLHAETLVETMRVRPGYQYGSLFLARWPVLEIISVTEGSTALTTDGWELDIPEGSITRLSSNEMCYWALGRVIIEYVAGYDPIPDDLKAYASQLVGGYHQVTTGTDPNAKHIEIPGVITIDRWVDQTATDSVVPDDIKSALVRDGYRRPVLA
jgi:hypothetical protein